MSSNHPAACLICQTEEADEGAIVFRDDLWAAEIVNGYEVPGWVILRARRHAERITGLTAEELAVFGRRARDLVAALTEVTAAPTTYLMAFAENYAHFHVLLTPRGEAVPVERRGGAILGLRSEQIDRSAAVALVPAVREAYRRFSEAPVDAGGAKDR